MTIKREKYVEENIYTVYFLFNVTSSFNSNVIIVLRPALDKFEPISFNGQNLTILRL